MRTKVFTLHPGGRASGKVECSRLHNDKHKEASGEVRYCRLHNDRHDEASGEVGYCRL